MSLNLDKSRWTRVAFGDVIESITDRVDNPSEAGVERYVGLEHLDPGVMTVQRWDSPDKVEAQKLRFQPGDVIFGRRRAYQKKVAVADFEGICSAHALVLRARPGRILPEFLPVFLSSDYFLDRAVGISVGSLSPTINWRDLKVEEFDIPPLDEQKRLAELLWRIEEHRLSCASLDIELAERRKGAFKSWLSQIRQWTPLSDQFEVQLGKMLSPKSAPSKEDPGVPYLANLNVRWRSFDLADLRFVRLSEKEKVKFKLKIGDVLVCEGGEIGRAAIWDGSIEECYYQKALHRLRPIVDDALSSSILVEYLEILAQGNKLAAHSTGTTFAHLTRERLMAIEIPAASGAFEIQGQIILDSFDQAQKANSLESVSLRKTRAAILTDVFGGSH